jgi:hypothetical protein
MAPVCVWHPTYTHTRAQRNKASGVIGWLGETLRAHWGMKEMRWCCLLSTRVAAASTWPHGASESGQLSVAVATDDLPSCLSRSRRLGAFFSFCQFSEYFSPICLSVCPSVCLPPACLPSCVSVWYLPAGLAGTAPPTRCTTRRTTSPSTRASSATRRACSFRTRCLSVSSLGWVDGWVGEGVRGWRAQRRFELFGAVK